MAGFRDFALARRPLALAGVAGTESTSDSVPPLRCTSTVL